jgi:hypothetical protein
MPLSKKAIYNVICNSVNGIGATNSQKKYNFDWSTLPQGKYEVHYSYVGEINAYNGTKNALLNVELGCSKVFVCGANTQAQTSNFLGCLIPLSAQLGAGFDIFRVEDMTNPPIHLDSKPSNNFFEVKVTDEAGALYTDSAAADLAPYILTLSFDLLEEVKDERNSSVYNDSEQVINSQRRNGQYGL